MSETARLDVRPADPSAPAAQIGAELRARRQTLGWKLPDLAASLRIRQSYLEAIEAGRIADLPGTTYALGFVRAYASAMGLPGEQVASRFRAESADAGTRPALSFPAPVPQRGVPAGALMLLGLVILAGAYSGWYYISEHQHTPPETVPPIPDHLLPNVAEKPLPTPSPQVASILPGAAAPTQAAPTLVPAPPVAAAQPAQASPAAPAPLRGPSPLNAPPLNASSVNTPSLAAASVAPVASPPTTVTTAAAPQGNRIQIKATALAWVTVKPKGGGPTAFNKLMHPGDSWSVPANTTGLLLTTGNAGATQLVVDNAPVVSLGPPGTVFRDLPLDPDMLKSGHLPPSRPPHPKPAPVAPVSDETEATPVTPPPAASSSTKSTSVAPAPAAGQGTPH